MHYTHAAECTRRDGAWIFPRMGYDLAHRSKAHDLRERKLRGVTEGVPDGRNVVCEQHHWNTGARSGVSFFYFEVWSEL